MSQFGHILQTIDRFLHRILLVVAQLALIGMTTIVCVTVFYRYVLNSGIIWAEEVPRLLDSVYTRIVI